MDRAETIFEAEEGIATLTLDRPEVRNAITDRRMVDEIEAACLTAHHDPEIIVLIVTGAGNAFSAGGNVKAMRERDGMFAGTPDQIAEGYRATIQRLPRALTSIDVATVAAVNGPAIGAGFDLALMCDLRIASTEARFAHTFIDLGIIPGDGGAWFLSRLVGWQRAAELAFTGRTLDAAEAQELGIVLEVVEPAELLPRARQLAELIASKPAHSVRLTKRLLRHARSLELDPFLDLSAAFQGISHHTDAHQAAVEEFFRRR